MIINRIISPCSQNLHFPCSKALSHLIFYFILFFKIKQYPESSKHYLSSCSGIFVGFHIFLVLFLTTMTGRYFNSIYTLFWNCYIISYSVLRYRKSALKYIQQTFLKYEIFKIQKIMPSYITEFSRDRKMIFCAKESDHNLLFQMSW